MKMKNEEEGSQSERNGNGAKMKKSPMFTWSIAKVRALKSENKTPIVNAFCIIWGKGIFSIRKWKGAEFFRRVLRCRREDEDEDRWRKVDTFERSIYTIGICHSSNAASFES
jgi:hypothetical protein